MTGLDSTALGDEPREFRGRVLDEADRPVAGADVCYFWSANGSFRTQDGREFDLKNEDDNRMFWGRLGQMAPNPKGVKTDASGRFRLKIDSSRMFLAMAMDADRQRGGLIVPTLSQERADLTIRLEPLVRVKAKLAQADGKPVPDWVGGFMHGPEDPERPIATTRLVLFGSTESRLEMLLPPGKYFLEANNGECDQELWNYEIVLPKGAGEVDLGVVRLQPSNSVPIRRTRSQAAGFWGDYTKHYGKSPPAWHVTDAKGVNKDVKLADYRGKWVLFYFWGMNCAPCLGKSMPELMKFYEEHRHQRERFEVLSIFIDTDEQMRSVADMDRKLEPIVKHVWGGKTVPFPILLDATFKTWENFGLPGLGTMMLVDPEGNLVEGDLKTLTEILARAGD